MKKSQRTLIIVVIIGTIIALAVVGNIAGTVEYQVLYSGMESTEAGEVYTKLLDMGIDAKARPGGTIEVPKNTVEDARLKLSAEGYPKTGRIEYDIYKEATAFGMTDTDKKIFEKLQLQQDIATTINKMDKVQSATVLLTIAEENQFVLSNKTNTQSTAAVMLVLKAGQTLTNAEADAIRILVSKSVPSLLPEDVAITDDKMNIYTSGSIDGEGIGSANEQLDLQTRVKNQLEQQIYNLLTPVFGTNNLSVSVNTILDFDKTATESITLTPPVDDAGNNGIVVALKETEERIINAQGANGGEPGQVDNGGGVPVYPELDAAAGDSVYYNVTREVNQEVNQLIQQIDKAKGTIKELTATILINGDPTELAAILPDVKTQVMTAIGIPIDRQESITVSAMPFQQNIDNQKLMEEEKAAAERAMQAQQMQQYIMYGIIGAIALIIVLMFLRASKKKKAAEAAEAARLLALEQEQMRVDLVADGEIDLNQPIEAPEERQNTTLEQIKAMIKKNPESVAQLLRNWLNEDLRR